MRQLVQSTALLRMIRESGNLLTPPPKSVRFESAVSILNPCGGRTATTWVEVFMTLSYTPRYSWKHGLPNLRSRTWQTRSCFCHAGLFPEVVPLLVALHLILAGNGFCCMSRSSQGIACFGWPDAHEYCSQGTVPTCRRA